MWRKKSSTARTLFFKLPSLSGFVIRGIYTGNHSMHNDGTTGATAVRKIVHYMFACVNIAYDKARQRWWFTKQSADRRWFISTFETTKEMPLIASIVWADTVTPKFFLCLMNCFALFELNLNLMSELLIDVSLHQMGENV